MNKKRIVFCRLLLVLSIFVLLSACHTDYWSDVSRNITKSPDGNRIAVSCHNCYATTLSGTIRKIVEAKSAGADLIELDVRYDRANGEVLVAHYNNEVGPKLLDVIANNELKNANQILFIEIKDISDNSTKNNPALYDNLINELAFEGYATEGRPVYIRSFSADKLSKTYDRLKILFPSKLPFFRFSRLIKNLELTEIHDVINTAPDYYNMFEFRYDFPNLFSAISFARNNGYAVNLFTIETYVGVWSVAFRNVVQAITIDDTNDRQPENIKLAKDVISHTEEILSINVMDQPQNKYFWYYNNSTVDIKYFTDVDMPEKKQENDSGSSTIGGSLLFDAQMRQHVKFSDYDNEVDGGYLVSAVVKFNDLESRRTQAILNKSESGGFALELAANSLRFGVHVNGAYRYASIDKTMLSINHSYHIVGAYDGEGEVHLWVNNYLENGYLHERSSRNHLGGVTMNDVPITMAADPQLDFSTRFHFSGEIQSVSVNKWNTDRSE